MRERIRGVKVRKLGSWNKDGLTGKQKSLMQAKQTRNAFISSYGQAGVPPLPGKGPSSGDLGRQKPSF